MRASQVDHFKRLLLEKQRELLSATSESSHSVPAAGALRGDSIEEANAAADAEVQIRLHQTDGPLLRAIEDALGRISQGTYGVCGGCGVHISTIRLEAVVRRQNSIRTQTI